MPRPRVVHSLVGGLFRPPAASPVRRTRFACGQSQRGIGTRSASADPRRVTCPACLRALELDRIAAARRNQGAGGEGGTP